MPENVNIKEVVGLDNLDIMIDGKDYDKSWPIDKRTAARGIITLHNKLLMNTAVCPGGVRYMFPGGGVEPGETNEEALIREVKEETGFTVVPNTIRYWGTVVNKVSNVEYNGKEEIHIGKSVYFIADVHAIQGATKLTSEELKSGQKHCLVSLEDALRQNVRTLVKLKKIGTPSAIRMSHFVTRDINVLTRLKTRYE